MSTRGDAPTFGVLAEFANAGALFHACEQVRDAGYKVWDSYSPFPVHGIERAMGLPASNVPWITLVGGLSGAGLAYLFQVWTSAYDYPLIISGKPLVSWPAFIPITFEVGVLGAAFGAFFGALFLSRLPRWHHPVFNSERFARVTDDSFFIGIEASDPKFDEAATTKLLQEAGATNVEVIKDE